MYHVKLFIYDVPSDMGMAGGSICLILELVHEEHMFQTPTFSPLYSIFVAIPILWPVEVCDEV